MQKMGPRWLRLRALVIQLSKIQGAANGKVETSRGRKSPAQEYTGSVAASGIFDEARAPKSIIQEGKKRFRGLMIVFMEIRVVTRFAGEI